MQFNLSGPFFDIRDGVRLLCSAVNPISITPTTYGKGRFSTATYGPPFNVSVGLLQVNLQSVQINKALKINFVTAFSLLTYSYRGFQH